jgi:hypothetical protein
MALSADLRRQRVQATGLVALEIVNTQAIFGGGFLAGGSRDHATAGNRGRSFPFTGAAGEIPMGFSQIGQTGNTSATPKEEARINEEPVYYDVAVTGIAGDNTDNLRLVYATDDNTFTLTRPTRAIPVGIITRYISSSKCRVRFFSFAEMAMIAMGGAAKYTWHLGVMSAGAPTGNVLTSIVMPHHGRFLDVYGIVAVDATDADVQQDINLEIDGTNVTGGVVTWLFSDAVGAKKSGTAITAANVFSEGSLLDVETVATVAGTTADPGLLNLYATVLLEPGL